MLVIPYGSYFDVSLPYRWPAVKVSPFYADTTPALDKFHVFSSPVPNALLIPHSDITS